jgi:predicted nucleotidyltransferase
VEYCYLFGSYAKGTASEKSDVDLLVHTKLTGMSFFGLVEELREGLKKKVDVLDQKQIVNNFELVNEILKDGIKIYG